MPKQTRLLRLPARRKSLLLHLRLDAQHQHTLSRKVHQLLHLLRLPHLVCRLCAVYRLSLHLLHRNLLLPLSHLQEVLHRLRHRSLQLHLLVLHLLHLHRHPHLAGQSHHPLHLDPRRLLDL